MKEKPILFNTEMVKAIIAGNKTQTRRVIKPQPDYINGRAGGRDIGDPIYKGKKVKYRYEIGKTLWVRETFNDNWCDKILYKADGGSAIEAGYKSEPKWKPSIYMPRKVARLFLKVTDIRIERVQDISEHDARAEGVDLISMAEHPRQATMSRKADFKQLWDSINKKRGYGWDKNPYVWVYNFEVIK